MNDNELANAKLQIDLREIQIQEDKLLLEKKVFERDNGFFIKNSAALLGAAISMAALFVSLSGIIVTHIQKNAELESVARQERGKLELSRLDSERKWRQDAAQYIATNREIIFSSRTDEQLKIRKVMELIYDSAVVDALFFHLEKQAPLPEAKQLWKNGQRSIDAMIVGETGNRETTMLPADIYSNKQVLISLLNSADRRKISNALIAHHVKNGTRIVTPLISSIQSPNSPLFYRVNLYILFTLARIPGPWTGSDREFLAIQQLAAQPVIANDTTATHWADMALAVARAR